MGWGELCPLRAPQVQQSSCCGQAQPWPPACIPACDCDPCRSQPCATSPGTAPAPRCLPVQDVADSPCATAPVSQSSRSGAAGPASSSAAAAEEGDTASTQHPAPTQTVAPSLCQPHSTQSPPAPSSRAAAAPLNPSTSHLTPYSTGEAVWSSEPLQHQSMLLGLHWSPAPFAHWRGLLAQAGAVWMLLGSPVPHVPHTCALLLCSCSAVQSVHGPAPSSQHHQHGDGEQCPAMAPVLTPGLRRSWAQPQHGAGSVPALHNSFPTSQGYGLLPLGCATRDAGAASPSPEAALSFKVQKVTSSF